MDFPARLHVLLAREAPIGVVLRRGPSKSVCTVLWDRKKDTFELGQWLRGRIYERRSDISPDGRHLIYFAMNGKWHSETKGSWTAISRAPWLKAVALFGKGDCWNGGGLFISNSFYWLNDGYGHFTIRDSREVAWLKNYTPDGGRGECLSIYYPRLLRGGWVSKGHTSTGKWEGHTIFEKDTAKGWILRKFAHEQVGSPPGKGCYWDEHELESTNRQERIVLPSVGVGGNRGKRYCLGGKGLPISSAAPR